MIRLTSAPVASLGTKNNDLLMTFRTNRKFPQLQSAPPPGAPDANADDFSLPPPTESGVQCWTGHGGYDGSDARKAIHGGRNVAGQGDGYHEPSAVFLEFHQSE